jgi:type IV pilus assembly protein PilW
MHSQRGRSLLEIFIALAIGAVIIAAVLATIGTTGVTGRRTDVQARMTEDAQIAFGLMGTQLRMAGSSLSRVVQLQGSGTANANYSGSPITACDAGFTNPAAGAAATACAAGVGNSAFAVFYEADAFNTVPVGAANNPTDCLGRPIAPQPDLSKAGTFSLAENRFYIAVNPATGDPELYCAGSGNAAGTPPFSNPVPLVGNVEGMQIRYLVQQPSLVVGAAPAYAPGLTAAQVTALPLPAGVAATNPWWQVTAMEVCLLMRSPANTATAATPYVDCNGAVVNPADRRIRRAVTTTLQLRNGTMLRTAS